MLCKKTTVAMVGVSLGLGLAGGAHAAVVTAGTGVFGPGDVIAPDQAVSASAVPAGVTPEATFEGSASTRVLQDFYFGDTNQAVEGENIFDFTSGPDMRLAVGGPGEYGTSGRDVDAGLPTSDGSAWRIEASNGGEGTTATVLATIDFGTYDSGSDTFDSSSNAVAGAAFTWNVYRWAGADFTVEYKDVAGDVLETQTFAALTENDGPGYFGYISGSPNIGSVDITIVFNGSNTPSGSPGSSPIIALDDMTIIPEPGSLALLGLGGLAMLGRRRRANG